MSMRQKTKRRLMFLLATAVSVAALLGGGYLAQQYVREQRIQRYREEGLDALKAKDYSTALFKLDTYLKKHTNDADVMLSFVEARRQLEEANGQHLLDSINMLRRYQQLKPDDIAARLRLLELYVSVGFNTEALAAADELLIRKPADVTVLKYKTAALSRLRRHSEALKTAQETSRIAPMDLDNQATVLVLLSKQGQGGGNAAEVIQYAQNLQQKYPDDPRFLLLVSMSHSMTGDKPAAIAWARKAAENPILDAEVASLLIHQLDVLEQFNDADRIQLQDFQRDPTPERRRALVIRLLQRTKYADVLTQTTPEAITASPTVAEDLTAIRLLALSKLGRQDEARRALDTLTLQGRTSQKAADWATILTGPAGTTLSQQDAKTKITAYTEALQRNSRSPFFHYFLSQVQSEAGERELALQSLQRTIQLSPPWAAPWIDASRLLLVSHRFDDSHDTAMAARLRAPDDQESLVQLAQSWATVVRFHRPKDAPQLLTYLKELRQRFPNEQRILPAEVLLLALFDKADAARQLLVQILASPNPIDQQTLLQLAVASRESNLALEEACYQRCEKQYGLTPDLAFAKAQRLFTQDKPAEGLALLDKAKPTTGGGEGGTNEKAWRTVRAQYLDMTSDPRAKAEWTALAEAHPADLTLQWSALASPSVQNDRNFLDQTLNRIRVQTGDQSIAWRYAKARWLLNAQSTEQEVAEASLLLGEISRTAPEMIPPRILLADALERLGNPKGAIEQLQSAINLRPGATSVAVELARLLINHGDAEQARQHAMNVARSSTATPEEKRNAASILAKAGSYDQALNTLSELYGPNSTDQSADLLLASLYRQKNQPDKALAVCKKLLEKPTPAVIQFASDLLASQGRTKEAYETLALLDTLPALPPGTKEMIRATYFSRYGTPDQAQTAFAAATAVTPANPNLWQQRILFSLNANDLPSALVFAQESERHLAAISPAATLLQNRQLVEKIWARQDMGGSNPAIRSLVMEMIQTTPDTRGIVETLQILIDAQAATEPPRQTLQKLRRIADRFPKVLSIQSLVIQLYASSGQIDEAIMIATRAMETFPTSAELAMVATNTLLEAGRWNEVLGIAQQWRQRSLENPLPADLAIADASLQLGRSRAVLDQLKPYLDRALAEPDNYSGMLLLYTQALLNENQTKTAEQILHPLLPKGPPWRVLWIRLANQSLRDPATAKAWMDHVAKIIPENAVTERVVLAESWRRLGERFKQDSWIKYGKQMLEILANRPDTTHEALLAHAMLREGESDLPTAETYYRKALQKKPDDMLAQNNLAMVLVHRQGNLEEALNFANQAIRNAPHIPNFYDTRAVVQLALRDFSGAIASMSDAVRLDGNNLEWRIHLAWLHLNNGDQDRAKRELTLVEQLQPNDRTLSQNSRQRLETLRTSLTKSTAAAK